MNPRTFFAGAMAVALSLAPTPAVSSSGPPGTDTAVRAIVICQAEHAWSQLNASWRTYGTVPVKITDGAVFCRNHFTLADLEASHADTVVLAAVAGVLTLKPETIQALQEYAAEGHTLLGVSLVFGYQPGGKDDNALAPLFGLAEQDTWRKSGDEGEPFTFPLREHDPVAPVLFRGVSNPYVSSNSGRTEKPTDSHWSGNELAGARYLGRNADTTSAITIDDTAGYPAIYIADTAYYESTPDDLQFLYNAIIYPRTG